MEQISAGFEKKDSLKELFIKYKDAFGYLFKDGNRFLSDQDYEILYTRLAEEAKWNLKELWPGRYSFYRVSIADKKFFYRIFGIYLREATYRYAGDLTSEGAFWSNLQKGILEDLQRSYEKIPGQEKHQRGENRGDTFWSKDGPNIQNELTSSGSDSLIRRIYSYFDDASNRISRYDMGGNVYVRHLTKLAGCPLNCNPVRNDYQELREKRTRNDLENFVNAHGSAILSYSPGLRQLLTDRICDYFDFLRDLEANKLNDAMAEMSNWCGFANSSHHYYYSWLQEELQGNQQFFSRNRKNETIQREYQNTEFSVIFNILNNRISVSCPDPAYVSHILREHKLEPRYQYSVESEGKDLFVIAPYGHINGRQHISIDDFNRNIFELFASDKIKIREIDGDACVSIKNPWQQRVSLFSCSGSPTMTADTKSYLILPLNESVQSVEGGTSKQILDATGGLNVYQIDVNADVERIKITTNSQSLVYDVQDARCLHLYQDKRDRKDVFIHQRPRLKFGVENVEFTHLGDGNWENAVSLVGIRPTVKESRLHVQNISKSPKKICLIPEIEVNERILPQTMVLPAGCVFWMAKNENRFCAYLKIVDGMQISNENWESLGNNLYQYKVSDYDEWKNRGFPIRFIPNGDVVLNAKCPYFNANSIRKNWNTSKFFLGANPFNDVIPVGGKFYFEWEERGCRFKIETGYDDKSLRECLKSLGLWGNIPNLTFGWSYENTKFTEVFTASPNYREPERPSFVYEKSDAEREEWLKGLLDSSVDNVNDFIPYERFSAELKQDIENKVTCGFFKDVCNEEGMLFEIAPFFYEKDVLRYREDLSDAAPELKIMWQHSWAELTNEKHTLLADVLKKKIQENDIDCSSIADETFLWTFVDEIDVQHYIDFQLQKKREFLRQRKVNEAQQIVDDFLVEWKKNCDMQMKALPIRDLLLNCESFADCSLENFTQYARYLNCWLSYLAPYIEECRNYSNKMIPIDFFVEDKHNKPIIAGGRGYAQIQVKKLSELRAGLYKQLKLENEQYREYALRNEELLDKVLPPLKFGVEEGDFFSFSSIEKKEMFQLNGKVKAMLWICLIKNAWIKRNRLDLCREIDFYCEQPEIQKSLSFVDQKVNSLFHGNELQDDIVKLANHLRSYLLPVFEKESKLWKTARLRWPTLKNVDLPPEVFIYSPKEDSASYIRDLAKQWAEKIH